MLSSQTDSFGCKHSLEVSIGVYGGVPLNQAVLRKLLYAKPWQMLPLVAMLLQIWASVSGSPLSCMP